MKILFFFFFTIFFILKIYFVNRKSKTYLKNNNNEKNIISFPKEYCFVMTQHYVKEIFSKMFVYF